MRKLAAPAPPRPQIPPEENLSMKNPLLTITLSGMLALGACVPALAQDTGAPAPEQGRHGGPRQMNPDRQLERLTHNLNLTADQQAQIKPLLVARSEKMQALSQNQSLGEDDRRAQMRTIHEEADTKINAVLNDDQKQKYAAMQQRMRRGPGGPLPESAPQPQ
jgi:Spy/CpxP family protein refolding chaperone